ncbi:hypothetical protein F0562_004345 [Nyssa sinensis]|uniref:Uncharacterized protein n=1 Tax=Nyssa sinensis TaxID=561372 RepID=A0A5J5BZ40_9ASTE|nr:hypothetical protein F0562_004345 [Nyssa sinensis]
MPQPQPRQQSGFNDMQMLQRHIMFKQLQELQRQQQLQELGDAKQQSYINQLPAINSQATGGQFPPLINGTPVHDASQMFRAGNMNLVQRGASPLVQQFPNGVVYSQAQSQALRSVGLVPQQLDLSLYGTPIGSARNNLIIGLSNSFLGDNCNVSSDQLCIQDGAFISKELLQGKNLFGKVPVQGLNSGFLPENYQQVNTFQRNASVQEFSGRQERAGWPGPFPGKTTQIGASQGLATLDPLEQKILFNMDDNSWDASFGRQADMGTGGFGNTLESTDYLNSLPSIQSGSWSALMQSAVAEASSSDTGLQEEWSGLSFQNTELSTENQPSNFVDSGKKQASWVDNNLQRASSISSKPQILFHDSNMSSLFPSFQQPGIQFSNKQREGMHSNSSHESIQQSTRNASKWVDCNPQQKQQIEGSQPVQKISSLENAWHGRNYMHPESDAHQPSISSYNNGGEPCNRLIGRSTESPSPGGNAIRNVCDNENAVNKFCAW